jgi:hypothetical protein
MFRHRLTPHVAAVITVASVTACSSSPASAPASVSISPAVGTAGVTPTSLRPSSVASTSSPAVGSAPTSSPAPAPVTTAVPPAGKQGVDPNAPEVVEPGDIPDNQVFVPYQPPGQHFFVKVPEGWAQTGAGGGATTFTDHYNSITIAAATADAAAGRAAANAATITTATAPRRNRTVRPPGGRVVCPRSGGRLRADLPRGQRRRMSTWSVGGPFRIAPARGRSMRGRAPRGSG